jgi:hypothetical protein
MERHMTALPNIRPEGFRERFVKHGWRSAERYYGARTEITRRWIADCGGIDLLQAERKAYRAAMKVGV